MSHGSDLAEGRRVSSQPRQVFGVAAAIVGCGVIAGALLPDVDPGLGFPLVALAVAATIYVADRGDVTRFDVLYGALAFLLTSIAVVRSAEWLVALCLLAAMALAVIAVTRVDSWRGLFTAPIAVLARFRRVPALVVRPLLTPLFSGRDVTRVGPVARGTAIAIFSLVLFGTLFGSADAAFARLAQDWLIPQWDLDLLPARFATGAIVALVVGALVIAKPSFAAEWRGETASYWDSYVVGRPPREPRSSVADWAIPVIALDALFATFVVVQISVLFGGREHVEVTGGLTYAEYARQGFFQLLTVAALVLLVIAAAVVLGRPREGRDRELMRWSLGVLCALTLVVLASALVRLQLYEETYGFTRLRVSVHATIYWLAGVFVLVGIAGIRWRARWLPRTFVAYTGACLLIFAGIDPEALIARENVRRFEETGRIDTYYLATLSADALPELLALPPAEQNCVLYLSGDPVPDPDPWSGFNFARERARDAMQDIYVPNDPSDC